MDWINVFREGFLRSLKPDHPQQSPGIGKGGLGEDPPFCPAPFFKLWYALEEPSLRIPYI